MMAGLRWTCAQTVVFKSTMSGFVYLRNCYITSIKDYFNVKVHRERQEWNKMKAGSARLSFHIICVAVYVPLCTITFYLLTFLLTNVVCYLFCVAAVFNVVETVLYIEWFIILCTVISFCHVQVAGLNASPFPSFCLYTEHYGPWSTFSSFVFFSSVAPYKVCMTANCVWLPISQNIAIFSRINIFTRRQHRCRFSVLTVVEASVRLSFRLFFRL